MEFTYSSFNGRLVLNPKDFILRFEHKDTFRTYERVFFDHEFVEFAVLGGIEFVSKGLISKFQKLSPSSQDIQIEAFKESPEKVTFTLSFTSPFFARPLSIPFEVLAERKQSASADVEIVSRKISDLRKEIEDVYEEVQRLDKELCEHQCLTLFNKPIYSETRKLTITCDNTYFPVSQETMGVEFAFYSSAFPTCYSLTQTLQPTSVLSQINQFRFIDKKKLGEIVIPPSYISGEKEIFEVLISGISSLSLEHLTIVGCSAHWPDLNSLFPSLKSLEIVAGRKADSSSGAWKIVRSDQIPDLKNVSWISSLTSLERVSFHGCADLENITPLKDLPNLKYLDIRETSVKNISFFTKSSLKIVKS